MAFPATQPQEWALTSTMGLSICANPEYTTRDACLHVQSSHSKMQTSPCTALTEEQWLKKCCDAMQSLLR